MKTITIVPNQNTQLYVVCLIEDAPPDYPLAFFPIVAWKVTSEDSRANDDEKLVYAEPLTLDPHADDRPVILDRSSWEWWGHLGESGNGKESLIEHLKAVA